MVIKAAGQGEMERKIIFDMMYASVVAGYH